MDWKIQVSNNRCLFRFRTKGVFLCMHPDSTFEEKEAISFKKGSMECNGKLCPIKVGPAVKERGI